MDPFAENILGVENLIDAPDNKVLTDGRDGEGVTGMYEDVLHLPMQDQELLDLRDEWIIKSDSYTPKIKPRQDQNKLYYAGTQKGESKVVSSNLIFEAEETFIPQALSKNPEPVVWSDNTDEGKEASNDVKTMLQYHADILCLRKKLGVMVRHWSIYFIGIVKHGWDGETKDIKTEIRKPQNFILDPDGYIDEYGNYVGAYLGEKIESSAEELVKMFPKHQAYILIKVNGKLGTKIVRTEWWTDKYCFTTFMDEVLDKHKNEYFNYETPEIKDQLTGEIVKSATPGINHFAIPKMPYTFLSVFSLQERPHDITNLIEQNVPNQDRINDRDDQITRNLRAGNNSIAVAGLVFDKETAHEAAIAIEDGDPILVPGVSNVGEAIKRIPANDIPDSVFRAQDNDKVTLRSVFGTLGSTPNVAPDQRVRNNILNEQHDASRTGGGVGDALEQVADNIFNWWLQLYCVFYDEPHYGAVMGNGRAVEYVKMMNSNLKRKFVVSVAPNSMKPKDEISEQNMAIERWNNKAIDPIGLMKAINDPDPMESAKRLVLWVINPQMYAATYFPEAATQPDSANPPNPTDIGLQPPAPDQSLGAPPASSALSQVPINSPALPK